jgi:hypothetical protein
MPIYQRPNIDIGVTHTVSGTTSADALVLLKNPSSDEVVATTTADGSGNYSFAVSNTLPLQVSVPSSVDPQILTTIDVASPAKAYADYGNDQAPMAVADFPQTTGSGASFYTGTPSVSIVDTTGSGTGAAVSITMANVSDPYASFSSRVVLDSLYAGVAKPLRQYTISNLGSVYETPKMRITGTQVLSTGLTPEQLVDQLGITTGFTYDGQNFYTEERTRDISCITRQIGIVGAVGVEQVLGSDHSLWGTYDNDYRGGRCTASFPGEQDITEPEDDSSVDGATAIQDVKGVVDNANYYNGSQLAAYFAIIYGQNTDDITHTGNPAAPFSGVPSNVLDGGALWAFNQDPKIISKQELDLLKGYFGRKLMVEPITGLLPSSSFYNSYTVSTVLLGAWNIIQGVTQTTIATEIQSFSRQFNGVTISDMSQRVKPILDKITAAGGKDFNTLQTQTNAGQRVLWNFNGTQPSNSNI